MTVPTGWAGTIPGDVAADVGEAIGIQIGMAGAAGTQNDLQSRNLLEQLDHVEHGLGHQVRILDTSGVLGKWMSGKFT
ncbi:MAG: hypothetical protein ACREQR_11455 [Candidatus Binataceae bacterium]